MLQGNKQQTAQVGQRRIRKPSSLRELPLNSPAVFQIISQFARPLPSKCVTPVCRPVPYNLRKRRPTTEFMSAADAAKVRSGLCAASPCLRRSKRLANLSNKKPVY